mmetsp:Transcript_32207/g.94738  ORF Transcript_32207/g.94738 Transcript_32207/m.94738 type:complete len:99 (-) Transcript_32207:75-371(-)
MTSLVRLLIEDVLRMLAFMIDTRQSTIIGHTPCSTRPQTHSFCEIDRDRRHAGTSFRGNRVSTQCITICSHSRGPGYPQRCVRSDFRGFVVRSGTREL